LSSSVAIELLQKLQQALVAQQQLQQQRQLQQLLLQLLSVQKSSAARPATSSQWTTPPQPKRPKLDSSSTVDDDDKSESPYSPPDSDGTPLGSPDGPTNPSMATQLPTENNANSHRTIANNDDMDTESNRHPSPNSMNLMSSAGQPVTLGTSQLAAATVHRKHDSTGLTPSLANYFSSQLIEHAAGWQPVRGLTTGEPGGGWL
jgi:type II secretory pathway pseudopilin PulG